MDASATAEILVVDHAPNFRELLDIFLTDEGYHVSDVTLDDTPLDQIVGHPAALYLVGLVPGQQKDLELLEHLRQRRPRSPVLVLATSTQLIEQVRSQPERYAGDRFLRLPLDLDDLLREVQALLPSSNRSARRGGG